MTNNRYSANEGDFGELMCTLIGSVHPTLNFLNFYVNNKAMANNKALKRNVEGYYVLIETVIKHMEIKLFQNCILSLLRTIFISRSITFLVIYKVD